MSTATLTSLAILKVNIDQGKDYLDYLQPFIFQVLVDQTPDPVTDQVVKDHILRQFGLQIPERTVQVVLKRISKRHRLKKKEGVYHITGLLPDPGIVRKQSEADRHIQAVVSGLIEFSNSTRMPISCPDHPEIAICAFLAEFEIPCLRAYLHGTAIPNLKGDHNADVVLVSGYVIHLQKTNPERFESFMVMVQGHMLANALLCPDLQNAPKTYRGVAFYFDTPLLIRVMGLEGKPKQDAVRELSDLLQKLGGEVCAFSHSREELYGVLRGAAEKVGIPCSRGNIITEALRQGTSKSDLLLFAEKIDEELANAGIDVKSTPQYTKNFQIDETAFEDFLDDEVSYHNPRAKQYDINSVRSIYVLRGKLRPLFLEKSRAVLVTSNSAFARAAWHYGKEYESSQDVSSVITDFGLANMAWLKTPMGAPFIPVTEILAFSYAALQPSKQLLDSYLTEIDRLKNRGEISEQDHQLLRSNPYARDELVYLTLNDDSALTTETVTETLRRVTNEITQEKDKELTAEKTAHRKTQEKLASQRAQRQDIQKRLFWRCDSMAQKFAWVPTGIICILLAVGIWGGSGMRSTEPVMASILTACSTVFLLFTLGNLFFGSTVKKFHEHIQNRLRTWLIKRETTSLEIDLEKFDVD